MHVRAHGVQPSVLHEGTPLEWLQSLYGNPACSDLQLLLGPSAQPWPAHAAVLAGYPGLRRRIQRGQALLAEWDPSVCREVRRVNCLPILILG